MAYYVENSREVTSNSSCSKLSILKFYIEENPKYFELANLFGEIVSDYQRTMARINLGIKDIENVEVYNDKLGDHLKITWKDGYKKVYTDVVLNTVGKAKSISTSTVQSDGLVIINGIIVGRDIPEGYLINTVYGVAYKYSGTSSLSVYNLTEEALTITIDDKSYSISASRLEQNVDALS